MLQQRIKNLLNLKTYLLSNSEEWLHVQELTERNNAWFTQAFIQAAIQAICEEYLDEEKLVAFSSFFKPVEHTDATKKVGLVMAGNIPLVGFHDLLCTYLSGHEVHIKLSSKDDVLMKHVVLKLRELDGNENSFQFHQMLKGCDAYIATGSNQSARIFEQYFEKFPHIIRRSKTSVGVLDGTETGEELELLADDVYLYFGLGCRNITKIYVPENYDFVPLLQAFRKYDDLKHHNKYRNNYDYQLALYILNNQKYMSNESILLIENKSVFSAVAVLHIEYYTNPQELQGSLISNQDLQAIVGHTYVPFGAAQTPAIYDFADGINTVEFLNSL